MTDVTTKTDDSFSVLSSKINTLKAAFDILDAQVAAISSRTIFPIWAEENGALATGCLLYTSPSPRDGLLSRMPSSA